MPPQVDIDRQPVAVILNLLRIQHESAIRAGLRDVALQAHLGDGLPIAIDQLLAELFDVGVVLAGENIAEGRKAGRHRNRIRVVGAAVKDLVLRDEVHHRLVRAEGRQREAAANGLRQADHIGDHTVVFRSATPSKLRPSLHFVEDKKRAILRGDLAQSFQEARLRHAEPDVHQDGLKNLTRILLEAALHRAKVVEGRNRNVGNGAFRNAQPAGNRNRIFDIAEIGSMRLDADQRRIVQPVITAFKFHDLVTPRGRAS